ncbi:MAG: 3-phosphoshikimate 1-carboxyvinyltransferase [Tissierellia bacterium]|nr:3-phosphoshikimate 1-carboxyvinyltransferase [Tissierellia bacterium]
MKAIIEKNSIRGEMNVPSSKSHTIRAVAIGALANGKSIIKNPLPSEDGKAALKAAEKFGVKCTIEEDQWILEGLGGNLKVPDDVINVDNSGTTLYMMTGLASLLSDWTVFTGDQSIRSRPATPLLEALNTLGATSFTTRSEAFSPPFVIKGPIKAGRVKVSGSPSQYISTLLLVAPMLEGLTRIETDNPSETPYVEMTIDWMRRTGISVNYDEENYRYFEVEGKQNYNAFTRVIPSDWSAVAFPLAAGLAPGSELVINNLDFNDKQGDSKIVKIFQDMGANIETDERNNCLKVIGGNKLHGITIDCSSTPDALPMLSVVASLAEGVTVLDNVAGVRAKETDRVAVMEKELSKMGAKIETEHNKMIIYGGQPLKGAEVESYGDHRVAMALSVAGLFVDGQTIVNDSECVNVSFPNFYETLNNLGAGFKLEK